MAFPKYIAWLNGVSVATGDKATVIAKAREIAATELWMANNPSTTLRVTTYGAQKFVTSIIL